MMVSNLMYILAAQGWLEFFNQYENLFMILITAVYLISSIFFIMSSYRANMNAELVLKEMKRQRKEENRPYVNFNVQMDPNRNVFFSLHNSGRTIARDIQLKFNHKLLMFDNWSEIEEEKRENRKEFQPQIINPINFLAPDNDFVELVGSFPMLYHAMDNRLIAGELAYYDVEGDCYAQTFELNLEAIGKGYVMTKATHFVSDTDLLAKFLEDSLKKTLENSARVCETLHRKLK